MNSPETSENEFIRKLTEIVEANITNPQFGVSMLAKELGISRFMLNRKVNYIKKITATQFINQVRLHKAKDILRHTNSTVSDVAFQTGFNSTSYFIKCFHEYYGYPPGEVGNRENDESNSVSVKTSKKRLAVILTAVISVLVLSIVLFVVFKPFSSNQDNIDKSVAVLMPENNSPDSTILIEGIINTVHFRLSLINDLKVLPLTSTRKYRNWVKTISEIGKELEVSYIVESSGFISDNEIRFNVSLINTVTHTTIWSHQYTEVIEDVFDLEDKISEQIVEGIDATITPDEQRRMKKRPTENRTAYQYYQKGIKILEKDPLALSRGSKREKDLKEALKYFKTALKHDPEFASAYAEIAKCYSYFFTLNNNEDYLDLINENADLSLAYDNESDKSWLAKATYYNSIKNYKSAIVHLNKALDYNPNSYPALWILSNIYRLYLPDSEQTLELRLRQNRIEMAGMDSINKSNFYVSLSDAFCEAGFFKEGKFYLNKALEYNPDNIWAKFNIEISYCNQDINYEHQRDFVLHLLKTKGGWGQSIPSYSKLLVARAYLYLGDYSLAYQYFEERQNNRKFPRLDYPTMDFIYVMLKTHNQDEAEKYLDIFDKLRNENKHSSVAFPDVFWAQYYALKNDPENALAHIQKFLTNNNYRYTWIRLIRDHPIFENLKDLSEYQELIKKVENKFWEDNKRIRKNLEKERLWPAELQQLSSF